MMRLFSPVTVQRTAVVDTELGGVTIKAGDRLAVSLACASRDPEAFAHPDQLDASRNPNPHLAFGFGIHRCAGAQLARRDIAIALERWFQRIPPFRLAPDSQITAAGGAVLCLDGVVLEWDRMQVPQ
jgi:cytochrome P450